jgi:DNA modification methylase
MNQDISSVKIKRLNDYFPDKKGNTLIFGPRDKILKNFKGSFKKLQIKLIFLDLSLHFFKKKKEFREEFISNLHEKDIDTNIINLNSHIHLNSNLFWAKTKNLIQNSKLILNEDGFFAVKVNGIIKARMKVTMDTIFGFDKFVNEIIIDSPFKLWHNSKTNVFERTSYVLFYTNSSNPRIKPVVNEKTSGGYWHSFVSKGQGNSKIFKFKGEGEILLSPPPGTHWKLKQETIFDLCNKGLIRLNKRGNPEYWVPLKKGQIIDSNWLDIQSHLINGEMLINSNPFYKRLFELCLNDRDCFLDLSPDMGNSLYAADNLKLNWIAIDENKKLNQLTITNMIKNQIPLSIYEYNVVFNDSQDDQSYIKCDKTLSNYECPDNNHPKILRLSEKFHTPLRSGNSSIWTNMLVLGDCLDIFPLLKHKLQNKLKLIYIDPPFFTGTNESIVIPIYSLETGNNSHQENTPYPNVDIAYKNILDVANPVDYFKQWLKKRVSFMKFLLRDDGFIFVRFDYHYGHYARLILDEIFGSQNFVIEFIARRMKKNLSLKQAYHQTHLIVHSDSIFVYQRSEKAKLKSSIIKKRKRKSQDIAEIQYSNDNLWIDIAGYEKLKKTLYPTENSEALLSRVIQISTSQGDIVADFFCGSGTTIAVAEKLNRKWIGVDIGHYSIHEVKKRFLRLPECSPFNFYNITSEHSKKSSSFDHLNGKKQDNLPNAQLEITIENNTLEIRIVDFIPSKLYSEVEKYDFIKYIDYWAIDWDNQPHYFRVCWYSIRKMKGKQVLENIEASINHKYSVSGSYRVMSKIVDIFGISTIQSLEISIS